MAARLEYTKSRPQSGLQMHRVFTEFGKRVTWMVNTNGGPGAFRNALGVKARVHWADLTPVRLFWQVLSARVNRLSDGRELTVSAGRLTKGLCPLNQFFLRTSVSRLTYVKKNGLVDTDL